MDKILEVVTFEVETEDILVTEKGSIVGKKVKEWAVIRKYKERSKGNSRARLVYRSNTNKERIRCREYDNSSKDCPNMKVTSSFRSEQEQQVINTEEEDGSLQLFAGK